MRHGDNATARLKMGQTMLCRHWQRRGSAFDAVVLGLVLASGIGLIVLTAVASRTGVQWRPTEKMAATNNRNNDIPPPDAVIPEEEIKRDQFRHQVNAKLVVAILDREFQFTAQQRNDLVEMISRKWETKWDNFPDLLEAGPSAIPRGLAGIVEPRLMAEQRLLWHATWRIDAQGRKVMGIFRGLRSDGRSE